MRDSFQNTFKIFVNIFVQKSQHSKALLLQPHLSLFVTLRFAFTFVTIAVQFDDQTFARTKEIDDERADWLLAAKAKIIHLPCAQMLPQNFLCRCCVAAQTTGCWSEVGFR